MPGFFIGGAVACKAATIGRGSRFFKGCDHSRPCRTAFTHRDHWSRLYIMPDELARLHELEANFAQALEREKLEALAEFAAGAGHEINNPLTVIAGRAQLLLREEADPERRHALALMNAQAMRIYEMIADMMLFARPPQPQIERFDAVQSIDNLVADLQTAAARQETVLTRTGLLEPLEIEADPTQIAVALRALVQNALEALGNGGRITVELQTTAEALLIGVCDDGPGISAEERRHIFDPFFSARQAGRGLGLGLSKCWRIVTNHGGKVEVESTPGQGAKFTITLPNKRNITHHGGTEDTENEG
jgi:signal transduction histidine kinase